MILYFDDLDTINKKLLGKAVDLFPAERQNHINKNQNKDEKILSIIAYILIIKLTSFNSELKLPIFSISKNGKPSLINSNKFISISHCNTCVACAISDVCVGIDVQEIQKVDFDVAIYVCNEKELKLLKSAKNQDLYFAKLWTKKESLLKYHGANLSHDMKNLDYSNFSFQYHINLKKQYVICICKEKSSMHY